MAAERVADGGSDDNGHDEDPKALVTDNMRCGLESLLQAARYAENADVDIWTFAVEFDEIRRAGLSPSDLRWLIVKGYVGHASESNAESADEREFEPCHRFRFTSASCFVLTRLGVEFVRLALQHAHAPNGAQVDSPVTGYAKATSEDQADHTKGSDDLPRWDSLRRELWVGSILVKRFRVPAPRQELVLAVFQEDSWPHRIDDPLPPQPSIDPKRHLHATISSLNRHQKHPILRFSGDGTGSGVLWQIVLGDHPSDS